MQEKQELDSKERLLVAATQLFAQKGLAGVSIREIAEAAEVNSALISYHFGGKDNLYCAVLESQFEDLAAAIDQLDQSKLSPLERLRRYAWLPAETHKKKPYLVYFMHAEITHPSVFFNTVVRKRISKIYQVVVAVLREGIESGQLKADLDVKCAAISLLGIINFYFISRPILQGFIPLEDNQPDQYVQQAIEIYLNGVSASE